MDKKTNIYEAIINLPDELITPEIFQAGIKEANIKLLNALPERYMTEENINYILDHAKERYCYNNTFDLSSIPEKARTQKVCDIAVGKSLENYFKVPEDKRSVYMLEQIMQSAHKNLHYFPLVPAKNWNAEIVLSGVKSIYSSGEESSSRQGRYFSSVTNSKEKQMKFIQILLFYVPEEIKDKTFWFSLFDTKMSVSDIDFLIPPKYKKNDYYVEIGKKDILAVPPAKLNYEIITQAMLSGKNSMHQFFDEKNAVSEIMFQVMDDAMADIIILKEPGKMGSLPQKFWKKPRLLKAIDAVTDSHRVNAVYRKFDITRFDQDICRAIVKKQEYECPQFEPHIWTPDFIDFCMTHCQSYYWFCRMPVELQTQEMVNVILEHSFYNLMYTRPDLITYDIAVKAYAEVEWNGTHKYENYIPKHYFDDFSFETGLPKEFFSGKRTYTEVREEHKNYTYCEIGDCFIGYFVDKDGREEYKRLIMTRRTPMSLKPSVVFSRTISTFHKTWFEKLIADSDPQFKKPEPGKGLKSKQINAYLDVSHTSTVDNTKIYAHSLMGVNVLFSAEDESEYYETDSLDAMKKKLKKNEVEYEIAS